MLNMKKELIVLWLDDKREPYRYFETIEKDRKKNKPISGAGLRNSAFYNDNIFNNYDVKFIWVKNIEEFSNHIKQNGLPKFISFDRDLTPKGWNKEHTEAFPDGLACIKWLKQFCFQTNQELPKCFVHSANTKQIPEMEKELGSAALNRMIENRTMKKNVVRLTEEQLHKVIKESVEKILYKQ